MGSGRAGLPVPSPTGESKFDQRPRRRKSGGGITTSMYHHHMNGKEQVLGLQENNGCKSNCTSRPIDHDLGNAATLRVSAVTSHKRLSPKSNAPFDVKQQKFQSEGGGVVTGSVIMRRKNRLNVGEGKERSSLNLQQLKGSLEGQYLITEELNSPPSINKLKTPRRKNSRTEVSEGIGLQQQSTDYQPNSRLLSRSGRSTRSFAIETGDGDLGLSETVRSTRQRLACRPHKRKAPEPNAAIPQSDVYSVHTSPIPQIPHFDPKPTYTHDIPPISAVDSKPIYQQNAPSIPHFDPEIIYPRDLCPIPPLQSESSSPHSTPSIPCSSPKLTDFEHIVTPIQQLCLEATDPHPGIPVSYPYPLETSDPLPISFERNGVQAPEPAKTSASLSRKARRTNAELFEEPKRLQYMDLIMWRDTPKSALLFGFGSFCVLSSSFTPEMHFSLVTFVSYLALIYLAAVFFYKTILRRGAIEQYDSFTNYELISEADALWVLRSTLPVVNLLLAKFQKLFSGDPATTMKLAPVLWLLAKSGHTMTIWTLAKLSFFAIFTIPKLYTCYSDKLHGYGRFMLLRFRDAWNTCSHKKGVLISVFLVVWNSSTVTARLWCAFILIVAFRLYHQCLRTDLDNQQVDPLEENIQIPETQPGEFSKLELMRIAQEVF